MKPGALSTRCARRRKAATSASDSDAATRSRDIETYMARERYRRALVRSCGSVRPRGAGGATGSDGRRGAAPRVDAGAEVGEADRAAVAADEQDEVGAAQAA